MWISSIYLLDTNIISETWKKSANSGVVEFSQRVDGRQNFVSIFTISELQYGINLLENGKGKTEFQILLDRTIEKFLNRITSPNLEIANNYASFAAKFKKSGKTKPIIDL